MAKILDNLPFSPASRIIKLRQKQDWLKAEHDALPQKCEEKLKKAQDRFIYNANKKLSSAAYRACEKTEYAERVMAEKLKKYDVSAYMSHRAVNHRAVKDIFKAIKAGKDWSDILVRLKAQNERLDQKRSAYEIELLRQKDEILAK